MKKEQYWNCVETQFLIQLCWYQHISSFRFYECWKLNSTCASPIVSYCAEHVMSQFFLFLFFVFLLKLQSKSNSDSFFYICFIRSYAAGVWLKSAHLQNGDYRGNRSRDFTVLCLVEKYTKSELRWLSIKCWKKNKKQNHFFPRMVLSWTKIEYHRVFLFPSPSVAQPYWWTQ